MSGEGPAGLQAALIKFAIRFRGIVIALACLLVGYGVYAVAHAHYDVFPEFAPPRVTVQTEAPGLTPDQVEVLVTTPIETAINGVPGVQDLRSTSIQGLSIVRVFFNPKSDVYRNRQLVAERLAAAGQQLPRGVAAPALTPLASSTSLVRVIGLTSSTRGLMDLKTAADWTVRQRLLAVAGVADVVVFGGDTRSLQFQPRPDRLVKYGLGLSDVLAAARDATGVRGAGFMETSNQRLLFQTIGQSLTPAALANTVVVAQGGGRVTLGDLGEVTEAPEPSFGAGLVGGRPGVVLNVTQQYGSNTLEVSHRLDAAIAELRPALARQGIDLAPDLFRPANFITTALANIRMSLILGAVLVIAVLILFLFNPRTAAISCAAIPLSLLAGAAVLGALGVSLNTMTLGGLAIAIGEVVDDAVIGVENIARRLRENRRLELPQPEARVVLDAVFEVRGAVVYATFAVILVFLPIVGLSGLAGRLFAPLALAYVLAVLASLLVALTVTPALAMGLLTGAGHAVEDPPVVRWIRGRYEHLLERLGRHERAVLFGALTLVVLTAAALPFFGGEFIPVMKEGHFIAHVATAPGASLQESVRLGERISARLAAVPGVRSVAERIGRAPRADDTLGPHNAEFEIDLDSPGGRRSDQVEEAIREALGHFVGVTASINTFLTERVDETISGYTAPVAINLYGDDLDQLDAKAAEIAAAISGIRGASGVQVQSPPGLPQITIRLREPDLPRWGLTPVEVLDAAQTAFQGVVVGQTYQGDRVFNVIVVLDPADRQDLARVGDLPLKAAGGTFIRLSQVADVFLAPGRYQVQHDAGRRLQTVTVGVSGRDIGSFVKEAKAAVAKIAMPAGIYVSFAGAAEEQARARHGLLINSLFAAVGVVLLLSVVTRHWRNLLLVLVNLPFALAGGVLGVLVTGGVLSIGSMVGFVTLFGITLRNSIMMISHFEHLVAVEGRVWGARTAIEGAADRVAPILMTSLVTGLGLLPLAIGMHGAGREIEGPMAAVILGGLLSSMALNLLILPMLAVMFGRFEPHQQRIDL